MKICFPGWSIVALAVFVLMAILYMFRKKLPKMPMMGKKANPISTYVPGSPPDEPMNMGGGIAQTFGFGRKKYKK